MDMIPSTVPKCLTSDTTFSNYLYIVDAYSKIPKPCGKEKICIEEVMDKMDMFQSRSGKIDEFGWWDLEIIHQMQGRNLPRQISNKISKLWKSLGVSSSVTSVNEFTSRIDMENVAYNFTITYGTC